MRIFTQNLKCKSKSKQPVKKKGFTKDKAVSLKPRKIAPRVCLKNQNIRVVNNASAYLIPTRCLTPENFYSIRCQFL